VLSILTIVAPARECAIRTSSEVDQGWLARSLRCDRDYRVKLGAVFLERLGLDLGLRNELARRITTATLGAVLVIVVARYSLSPFAPVLWPDLHRREPTKGRSYLCCH
jgi:hypothetical protein